MAPTIDEDVVGLHCSRVGLGHAVAVGWCGPQPRSGACSGFGLVLSTAPGSVVPDPEIPSGAVSPWASCLLRGREQGTALPAWPPQHHPPPGPPVLTLLGLLSPEGTLSQQEDSTGYRRCRVIFSPGTGLLAAPRCRRKGSEVPS